MPVKTDVPLTAPRATPAVPTVRSLWRVRTALTDLLALLPREVPVPPGIHPSDWEAVLGMIGAEVGDAVAAGGVPATAAERGELVTRLCHAMRARVREKYSPGQPGADRWLAVDRSLAGGTGYLPVGDIGWAVKATLAGYTLRATLLRALQDLGDEARR